MNKKQKEVLVGNFLNTLSLSKAVFIIDFVGVSSFQVVAFKKKLFGIDSKMMIMKNSLLRIAAKKNNELGAIAINFVNQIALVYAYKDPFATSIALNVFLKNMKNINFKSGLLNGSYIDTIMFKKIAEIGSEKMLHSKLCGVIRNPIIKLISVLSQIAEKQKNN